MKTKIKKISILELLIFAAVFAILFIACKKKEVPVTLPASKVEKKMTEAELVLRDVQNLAKQNKLEVGEFLSVSIDTAKVKVYDAQKAVITRFKISPYWTYSELDPVLRKIALTVLDENGLLVENYEDFVYYWKPGDNFLVIDPKPVYYVQILDGKAVKREYWINSQNNLWRQR